MASTCPPSFETVRGSLGVLPMIIAATSLRMPMGVVICFGTLFTLPLTVTILPVVYWKVYARKDESAGV